MIDNYKVLTYKPSYHLLDPSPWPIASSFSAFIIATGLILYTHTYQFGGLILLFGINCLSYCLICWWRDVIRESTFEGHHTHLVQVGLRYGVALFIVSEFIFFISFFWTFLHSSLSPTLDIGGMWPPYKIELIPTFGVPFLNTLILLLSGISITWSHHSLLNGYRKESLASLIITIILAVLFLGLQIVEYVYAPFNISDSIYGSIFFLATGGHGMHIIVGVVCLIVCGIRLNFHHFSKTHHFGLEAAIWYYHFVDVVWLLLFGIIYWWGGA